MTNLSDRDAALRELDKRAGEKHSDVAALMSELLSRFDKYLWDEVRHDFNRELSGFPVSVEYYQKLALERHHSGYMADSGMYYRERPGRILVRKANGSLGQVQSEIGRRKEYFIGASIKFLQELCRLAGDEVIVEMPELTQLIGKQEGGSIVMICDKKEIEQMIAVQRRGIRSVIHVLLHPDTWDRLDEHSRIKRERST